MTIRFRNGILLVKDIQVSKHFYQEVLGLKVVQDYDTFIMFQDNFSIHTADLFYEYINKPYHGEKMGRDNVDCYFTTPELETVQSRLKEQGVEFIHEIRLHAWGEKVIRIYDPDGHILEIGDFHESGDADKDNTVSAAEEGAVLSEQDNGITDTVGEDLLNGFTHMKQSTIKITADKAIYIDPYDVDGTPEDADIIFITHTHGDHLSIADIRRVAKSNTKIVVPADGASVLVKGGFTNLLTVAPSEYYRMNGVSFETVPSYNTNKDFHKKASNWVGYILTLNQKRYYFAGDTDVIPEMSTFRSDVAFLPVGGTYTMTAAEAAQAANRMKPLIAVPIHYADVVGTKEDAVTFVSLLDKAIKGMILKK